MDKKILSLSLCLAAGLAGSVSAQLPSNPWAPHPNDGYFENVPTYDSTQAPEIPEYNNGQTGRRSSSRRPLGQIARPQRHKNLARQRTARPRPELCRGSHHLRNRLRTRNDCPRSQPP